MEDPTVVKMNLARFRRLLETEADPAKRQMLLKLIAETEAILQPDQYSVRGPVAQRLGIVQMTASARTPTAPCHARASPTKPTPPTQRPQRDLYHAQLAVGHELSERLTTIGNYLAAALRLSETQSVSVATPPRHTEILKKALGQVSLGSEEIKRFRNLLTSGGIKAGPVYRVCFLNEFARFGLVARPCQRAIIIRSTRSRERAIEAAKKRFARLEGVRDWRDHAKIIEVSIIEDDPSQGVPRR